MGWRSLCVAQTSRSLGIYRERDASTTNLQLGDAPIVIVFGQRIREQSYRKKSQFFARMLCAARRLRQRPYKDFCHYQSQQTT